MALWGIPFVLVGLYIIAGRFWIDARRRSRTRYAVTSDRAIITSGLFSSTVQSIDLRSLRDLSVDERADGTGTLYLGARQPWSRYGNGFAFNGVAQTPAFEGIPEARRVYNIIREAQQGATPSR